MVLETLTQPFLGFRINVILVAVYVRPFQSNKKQLNIFLMAIIRVVIEMQASIEITKI